MHQGSFMDVAELGCGHYDRIGARRSGALCIPKAPTMRSIKSLEFSDVNDGKFGGHYRAVRQRPVRESVCVSIKRPLNSQRSRGLPLPNSNTLGRRVF